MTNVTFCDLKSFSKSYGEVHGNLSFFVCVFGSIANVLNICVLTSKEMRWPTNLILTGLAVSDLMVMLEYIPFTLHRYLNREGRKYADSFSYNWAVFMLFHALFSQIFHFISCCLTVVLAIWRYVTISKPHNTRIWCSLRKTIIVIVATYFICPVICIPLYMSLEISKYNQSCDDLGKMLSKDELKNYSGEIHGETIYVLSSVKDASYKNISFWVYSVVIKLFPCMLLIHLSCRLISVLLETKRRRRILMNANISMKHFSVPNVIITKKYRNKQADRTSTMLLAVLILFLVTEVPQAILGLLSAIIGDEFEKQCYTPLGDLMDIFALINSAINFILYCVMSRQFRSTFKEVFRPRMLRRWLPVLQQPPTDKDREKTQLSQV